MASLQNGGLLGLAQLQTPNHTCSNNYASRHFVFISVFYQTVKQGVAKEEVNSRCRMKRSSFRLKSGRRTAIDRTAIPSLGLASQ